MIVVEYVDDSIEIVDCWRALKYILNDPYKKRVRCYRKVCKEQLG